MSYGRQGQAISISSSDLVTDHVNKYTISATEFPADQWKYVLATSLGDVEQISPARVVPGKDTVTLLGLKGGEQAGLTSGDCKDIVLNSGASASKTVGTSLLIGNSLDFAANNLVEGTYKTCIIRTSDGCGKAGDFQTSGVSGASLVVVKPKIDANTKVEQSTATTIAGIGGVLSGDIFRLSTISCEDARGASVTVTEAGKVNIPNTIAAGKLFICFATKEDPSRFMKVVELTVAKGTKPPPSSPTTGIMSGSTSPKITGTSTITPTVVIGAVIAMLSMALLQW